MIEFEQDVLEIEQSKKIHFEWVLPVLYKPRTTLLKVAQQNNAVWFTPLLILSILLILLSIVGSPIRAQNSQMGATLPPDFEYYPPEQQQKIIEGQQNISSPVFTLIYPMVGSLASLWVGWLLTGSVLHLALTLTGSSSRSKSALNIAAWSTMPLVIRYLVQLVALLVTHQLITSPGLSGFFATDMGNFRLILSLMFGFIDLYFIWQVILLAMGVKAISNFTWVKTWIAVSITILIMLVLQALPGFIAAKLGNVGSSNPYFFF